jgi:hypothetical protein
MIGASNFFPFYDFSIGYINQSINQSTNQSINERQKTKYYIIGKSSNIQ